MMRFVRYSVLVLVGAMGGQTYASDLASFQLQHSLGDTALVFFTTETERVFRFKPELKAEDLGAKSPISALEILSTETGEIKAFAVFRFSGVEVYEIRAEDSNLKFVKKEGQEALFSGLMSDYRASQIASTEVIRFLSSQEATEIQQANSRILKVLKLIGSEEKIAQKPAETRKEFLELLEEDVREIKAADQPSPKELSAENPEALDEVQSLDN